MAFGYDGGGFFQQPVVQGALPFGRSQQTNNPVADYNSAYNNALAMNQANYSNILLGYQQAIAQQSTAQQAIQAGYTDLYNNVLDKVKGVGQARSRSINDASEQFLAAQTQSQIDRGLGNTTITTSTARGVEADRQQRQIENDESIAKLMGDYMSTLGTNRLRNASEGLGDVTGLTLRQLDFMNSVNSKYPDYGTYADLARQDAEAGVGSGAGGGQFGGGSFAGASPRLGYVPGPGPYYGGGAVAAAPTGGGGGSWLMSQYNTPGPGALANYYGGSYGGGHEMSHAELPVYSAQDYGGGGDF